MKTIALLIIVIFIVIVTSGVTYASPYGVGYYDADVPYDSATSLSINTSSLVSTFAGSTTGVTGNVNGDGVIARFNSPNAIARDSSGNLYVNDVNNNSIRKVSPVGVVSTLASGLNYSEGIGVDSSGNAYISDYYGSAIDKVTSGGIESTFAGGTYGLSNGTGTGAQFEHPWGIAVDSSGNVYVADQGANNIRKITSGGVVTSFAGSTAGTSGYGNGTGSGATFNTPSGLGVDSSGNIYVADTGNNAIRKITPGGVVTTLAGLTSGASGSANGTGSAASFSSPRGVAADASGNVYVADSGNNLIREITPAGVVTTFAGSTSGYVNGLSSSAEFHLPEGVVVDSVGDVYVADFSNSSIREITPNGAVNIAITPTTSGTLATATGDVAVTSTDVVGYNLYISAVGSTSMANGSNSIPASGNGTELPLAVDTWGYNVDGSSNFLGMGLTNTLIASFSGPVTSTNTTLVTFGVKLDLAKAAGQYSASVIYTAVPQTN